MIKRLIKWWYSSNENKMWHGKRCAVFGPNYIWTGNFIEETKNTLTLENVVQLFETGPHSSVETECEAICKHMTFMKAAICNIGNPIWTNDEFKFEKNENSKKGDK
jgi:hypothetical protein